MKTIQYEFLPESPDELVCKVINKIVDFIPVVLYTSRSENEQRLCQRQYRVNAFKNSELEFSICIGKNNRHVSFHLVKYQNKW